MLFLQNLKGYTTLFFGTFIAFFINTLLMGFFIWVIMLKSLKCYCKWFWNFSLFFFLKLLNHFFYESFIAMLKEYLLFNIPILISLHLFLFVKIFFWVFWFNSYILYLMYLRSCVFKNTNKTYVIKKIDATFHWKSFWFFQLQPSKDFKKY
jgi:hypothetical protein